MSHKPPWGVIVRPGLNSHVVWKEPSAEYLRSWGQFNQTLYRVNTEPGPWPQPWPPPGPADRISGMFCEYVRLPSFNTWISVPPAPKEKP